MVLSNMSEQDSYKEYGDPVGKTVKIYAHDVLNDKRDDEPYSDHDTGEQDLVFDFAEYLVVEREEQIKRNYREYKPHDAVGFLEKEIIPADVLYEFRGAPSEHLPKEYRYYQKRQEYPAQTSVIEPDDRTLLYGIRQTDSRQQKKDIHTAVSDDLKIALEKTQEVKMLSCRNGCYRYPGMESKDP